MDLTFQMDLNVVNFINLIKMKKLSTNIFEQNFYQVENG